MQSQNNRFIIIHPLLNDTMIKNVLLLLQLIVVALYEQNLFVDAKHKTILRGSQVEKELGDGLPGFDLPEAAATQNQRLLKDEKGGKGPSKDEDPVPISSREGSEPNKEKEDKNKKDRKDKNDRAGDKEDKNENDGNNESDKNNQESPTLSPVAPPVSAPIAPALSPVAPPVSAPIAPALSPVAPPVSAPTDEPMVLLTMAPSSTSINLKPVPVPTISTTLNPTVTLVLDPETSPPIDPVSEPISDPAIVQDPTDTPTSSFTSLMTAMIDPEVSSPIESVSKPVTSPTFVQAPDPAPIYNLIQSSDLVSARTMAPSVYTANHDGDKLPGIEFDKNKFVDVERLHPIKFNMTVSEFTQLMNTEKLDAYFKDFIENVLDMRSNRDWYPFNYKSVHNITMELLPIFGMGGDRNERSAKLDVPVQLILNGLIFVHLKDQGSQQTISTNDSVLQSTFHDSFAYSMLLYFTFWGVDSLQNVLEEDGGIQNPVVNSVSVGDKQLITIDKDGNYFAYMDEGDGPSNSLASETSKFEKDSSTRLSKYGVPSLIMISASTIWFCV